MTIKWSDIVAECGNYKSGFVATFHKYEGQGTDERDDSNRVVTVNQATFADHMGIPRQTFRDWVRREVDTEFVSTSAREARTAASHANVVKNMARSNPAALVNAIQQAGTAATDQTFHELKLRRAGIDTTEATRKASVARAHQALEPVRKSVATVGLTLCVQALVEAKEHLQEAISEDALDEDLMAKISQAHEDFAFVLTEARFKVS